MAKSNKLHPNTLSRDNKARSLKVFTKRPVKAPEKKEFRTAVCSVCMEFPHNAVLLLCSSFGKGCWPYMCATGRRLSNCLEQYKKAYTKSNSDVPLSEKSGLPEEKTKKNELLCPLCRGEVKGWVVVDPARKYLNSKKRTCMQDDCSFVGNYKQLKKHVKLVHTMAPRPRDVDPAQLENWKKLENERELSDVLSTIRSTMPGTVVVGDYVYDENEYSEDDYSSENDFSSEDDYSDDEYWDGSFHTLPTYAGRGPQFGFVADYDSFEDDDIDGLHARGASRHMGNHVTRNARSGTRLFVNRRGGRPRRGR